MSEVAAHTDGFPTVVLVHGAFADAILEVGGAK
jgi:hypothetical protein